MLRQNDNAQDYTILALRILLDALFVYLLNYLEMLIYISVVFIVLLDNSKLIYQIYKQYILVLLSPQNLGHCVVGGLSFE